ncbi:protein GLUTAMINE DUMPER 5-like protein [Cinnamomum micranthum f. kanehirae]|uniref:Protein GLUTAMINE DUMPER 5-like protein n=1 Tax=Cinnamomum micranthum f. kanehirae TaxID=337451 RepID=A0A3S3PYM9_9MAGN|nr:protein GLUTAMINE DUMPER 5-like protein [Cinnamomum micranthum f. kanehirae]
MRPLDSSLNTTITSFHHSPWRSPVPYLFGGLALMLCIVAFALLLLACSYWNLSNILRNRDLQNRDEKTAESIKTPQPSMDLNVVVIMAGDDNPTYLANPISNPTCSSLGDAKENEEKLPQIPESENKETQLQD